MNQTIITTTLIALGLSIGSISTTARAESQAIPNITVTVDGITYGCGAGGTTPQPPIEVRSSVDLNCLQQTYDRSRVTPSATTAEKWAQLCRGSDPDPTRCVQLSTQSDVACFDRLIDYMRVTPGLPTTEKIHQACQTRVFACRL